MRLRFSILPICGIFLLLASSCSTTETEFRVLNRSPYPILVTFQGKFNLSNGSFTLTPGMDKHILNVEELTPILALKEGNKKDLISAYFKDIEIAPSPEGGIRYQANVLDQKQWEFEPNGYQDRGYVLIIKPEDFDLP